MADEVEPIDGFIPRIDQMNGPRMPRTLSEHEKAKILAETRKDYLRTHSGPPAQVEADAWVAVYRKAASLVKQ